MTARECAAYTCRKRLRGGRVLLCDRCWDKVPPALRYAYADERNTASATGEDITVELLQATGDVLTAVNGGTL